MAIVSLSDICVRFGGEPLLDSIGFRIEKKERVCLVGRNGAGKTTLLKIIQGEADPDSGSVERGQGVRISCLAQQIAGEIEGPLYDVVRGGFDEYRITTKDALQKVESTLSRMELCGNERFENLSGGLKRRALLARALVIEPDLLLLDEPTNHIDIDAVVWLESFLLRFDAALLFVSHDRVFSQKLATRILDLDRGMLTSYRGSYLDYQKKKKADLDSEAKQNFKFDKKLAEEEIWIRQGVRARRTRNEGRVRALMRMREIAQARRKALGKVKIELQQAERTAKEIIRAEELSFGYPGEPAIVDGFTGAIYRGEKVGIIGRNGVGKTTLINLLIGKLSPSCGSVEMADSLKIAFLDQLRETLDYEKTVIENVIQAGDSVTIGGKPKHIISYLKDFLFSSDRAQTPVWVLSGGERNRLLLARLFSIPSNLFVLDEPTNDLDSETLELLEEKLAEYEGTVILVSHDRAFLNNVVTSTIVFEGEGKIQEYAGGYDDWLSQSHVKAEVSSKRASAVSNNVHRKRKQVFNKPKLSFKDKNELAALPMTIESLEEEQDALRAKLADPEFYKESGEEVPLITKRLEDLGEGLKKAYARWEELDTVE